MTQVFGNPKVIDHPFVAALARELWEVKGFKGFLKENPDKFKRACVVGLLLEFFAAPKRSQGDFLPGMTEEQIDRLVGVPGFARAMGLTGLISKETYPEEGMQAFRLEEWFDPQTAGLLRALCEWWLSQPAAEVARIVHEEAQLPGGVIVGPKKPAQTTPFDEFWAAYPDGSRKVDKKNCKEKYARILKEGVAHEKIMEGLSRWLKSSDWKKESGKYVPLPLTWLNQARWDAKPEPAHGQQEQQAQQLTDEDMRKRREEFNKKIAASGRPQLNGCHPPSNEDDGG